MSEHPKKKTGPKITFGPMKIAVSPILDIEKVKDRIRESRKFQDKRLKELRKKMFRRDI